MQTLRNLFSGKARPQDAVRDEEAHHLFKTRYHTFRLLLAANNRTLELMTDIEEALRGNRPFGMSFIRSRTTAIATNVYRIIQNLCELNPQKYESLKPVFRKIQHNISMYLKEMRPATSERYILRFDEIDKHTADQVGSKMANLGELKNRIGLRVPDGFVITTRVYHEFMQHNGLQDRINCLIQATPIEGMNEENQCNGTAETIDLPEIQPANLFEVCAQIQGMIATSEIPEKLQEKIMAAYDSLCSASGCPFKVSLRSSALGEDTADTSFAGQYRSELNVERENILHAYRDIVASKYSLRALTYRFNRGIRDEDVPMCVGCMPMVPAKAGGVLYTRNPLDIRDTSVYINAVWGLAKSVVDGSVAPDLFVVEKQKPHTIVHKDIQAQNQKLSCDEGEGIKREEVEKEVCERQSIRDDQAQELAHIADIIERHYGHPQDIEWSIDVNDTLFFLQSRPLTQRSLEKESPTVPEKRLPPPVPPVFSGGITASSGACSGKVFIVHKDVDILFFPEDAILVSSRSLPRWAAVLGKARGVITEHGSVAGHLANVAREFGIPALFGVKNVTSLLANGQEITLDADGRALYPGRINSLLHDALPRKNLMHGSPVYNTLKNIARYVLPLNLLDPESLAFSPSSCRTYHDITRFVHEKAVQEMFDFGKTNPFSPRSSKQLKVRVPMQWWIINLDDGFTREVTGKFVHLDDIASIPMLAIWKGCVAIPWEGPPSIDGKGFMNVMMQSATNPHLNPTVASDFTNRNYFMISRNFCNLQSRFGYHFTSIEALIGERIRENYLRFQFKGGAADYKRKVRRAHFIGEILEQYDFQTRVREDAMFARMDNYEQTFLEERLHILGYLLMHTRQLDMIMSNETIVAQYREKIIQDIEKMRILYSREPS